MATRAKQSKKDHEDFRSERQARAQLESIQEMVKAMEDENERENAIERIWEDPLSVQVRSDWYTPGDREDCRKPSEYTILLCTGGPACRMIGTLNEYGEPETATIEHQDWGTPWTELRLTRDEENVCLQYAQQFCFGQ